MVSKLAGNRMARAAARKPRTGANHELVFAALREAGEPLTAYKLLEQLKDKGICAPLTVYRALDRLIEAGVVHRLESANAFVACAHPHHSDSAIFAICATCGKTAELPNTDLAKAVALKAKRIAFEVDRLIVEIRGRCRTCRQETAPQKARN